MDNLDFLDELPDSLALELCGVEMYDRIKEEQFQRFRELDICEITANGERLQLEVIKHGKPRKEHE